MQTRIALACAFMLAACASPNSQKQAVSSSSSHAPRGEPFAVVRVDDSVNPIAVDPDRDIPWGSGMAVFHERSMVGDGHIVSLDFVRVVAREGETPLDACARFESWAKRARLAPLPPGDRFACGEVLEGDPDSKEAAVVGVRTYVVAGEPVLTQADVVDAYLGDDLKDDTADFLDVAVKLSPEGRKKLREATSQWMHRRMAILRDGIIVSAPLVKGEIDSDTLTIAFGPRSPAELDKAQAFVSRLLGK